MRFQSPEWLWLILAAPLAYFAFVADERRRAARFARFADPSLWNVLAPEYDPGARLRKARAWLVALALGFLAMARPQWGAHEEVTRVSGLDVMVVLDVSNSMEVEDISPGRLKKAKHFLKSMLERMGGDRVGVVAFAGSAYVASPLTTDLAYVGEVIEQLSPRSVQSQGTDIGVGLETARKSLERGAEESQDGASRGENSSQVIVVVSDGEDHEDGAIQAAGTLKNLGVRLFVFGIGTERGGPIPLREENGNLVGYKKDRSGKALISTFHPDALMKVASSGSGKYWNITPSESELAELLAEMKGLSRSDHAERRTVVYQERFQYPLALAILVLLWEFSVPLRRRRLTGAKGAAAAAALLAFLAQGCGNSAESYFENEKGVQAFESDRIEEAKRSFGNAQAKQPDSAELKFNQGAVQLRQAAPEGAAQSFLEAMTGAARSGDAALAGKSAFNAADAMTKKGDPAAAMSLYAAAIEFAKKAGDPKLEADARKNLELLAKQMEQQKNQKQQQDQQQNQQQQQQQNQQQQQQQQQQKDQQKQDQKQQPQDQDQDKDKDQQQAQKQYQQNQKQKFRSLKLSDEDAERVMAELKERERELQNRLRRQGGKPQGGNGQKDW